MNTEATSTRGPAVADGTDPEARRLAVAALGQGLVVAVPTDTVYGIAARLDRPEAIARLFELKGRRKEVAIAVLVHDLFQAESLGLFSPTTRRLAEAFWPGPLTIVVDRPSPTPGDAPPVDIGGDGRTVGIRVPDHADLLDLLEETGPLATTSANRSGEPTPVTVQAVAEVFGAGVAAYLDGGPSAGGPASTVVRDEGGILAVLREGPIKAHALESSAQKIPRT